MTHSDTIVWNTGNSHRRDRAKIERKGPLIGLFFEEEARACRAEITRGQSPGTMIPIDGGPRCIRANTAHWPPPSTTTINHHGTEGEETSGCTGNRTIARLFVDATRQHNWRLSYRTSAHPPTLYRSSLLFRAPLPSSRFLISSSASLSLSLSLSLLLSFRQCTLVPSIPRGGGTVNRYHSTMLFALACSLCHATSFIRAQALSILGSNRSGKVSSVKFFGQGRGTNPRRGYNRMSDVTRTE